MSCLSCKISHVISTTREDGKVTTISDLCPAVKEYADNMLKWKIPIKVDNRGFPIKDEK